MFAILEATCEETTWHEETTGDSQGEMYTVVIADQMTLQLGGFHLQIVQSQADIIKVHSDPVL